MVIAPFPAESQAAKRTQACPPASKGIRKVWRPKAGRSFAATVHVLVRSPSPATTSTKSSGNVHSTSATSVRSAPAPS